MATSQVPQGRPYQGYPYVNPVVIDVPTIDPDTASRYASRYTNLPRRQIGIPAKKNDAVIDIPSNIKTPGPSTESSEENIPVVYIDLPDETQSRGSTLPRRSERGEENNGYVEDTIFYDPFEDRRIDVNRAEERKAEDASPSGSHEQAAPSRPTPPNSLNLYSPGSSGYGPSINSRPSPVPSFMVKEAQVYRQPTPDDGFSLTPLPVTDFPEPPPAYTEIDSPRVTVVTPPRTEVIIRDQQSPTVGLPSSSRKLVTCQHCGLRVHTLVVREPGVFTHLIAVLTILFCIIPLTVVIYCTDCCKYRNHYCPNCNQLVGYEVPLLCQNMVYSSK